MSQRNRFKWFDRFLKMDEKKSMHCNISFFKYGHDLHMLIIHDELKFIPKFKAH